MVYRPKRTIFRRPRGQRSGDEAVRPTDRQWAVLEPLLPKPKKPGWPPHALMKADAGLSRLIDSYLATPDAGAPARSGDLTPRETETLTLVAQGLTNSEIADRLTISHKTVKTHIVHLPRKLDARDRVQLVIAAYRIGLVTTRDSPASS